MKKKTGLLFVVLSLALAFSSAALAGDGYVTYQSRQTTLEKRFLSAREIETKYVGVEPVPMPLPRFERAEISAETKTAHTGTPLQEYHDPANMLAEAYLSRLGGAETVTRGGACPASDYSHSYDTDYYSFPAMAVGKLLFTGSDGARYMCTGAVVNESLMLTAGHCVCGDGEFYSDFAFTPGYCHGSTPYETWTMKDIVVLEEWYDDEDFRYDVAFVILNSDADGNNVGDYVGWLGFTAGLDPADESWDEYGYPNNLAGGEVLSRVTSAFGTYDKRGGYSSNPTIGVGSNMLDGCSGGPWVRYDGTNGYEANGVNSYGYTDCNYTIYGPYFNTEIWEAYEYAKTLQ